MSVLSEIYHEHVDYQVLFESVPPQAVKTVVSTKKTIDKTINFFICFSPLKECLRLLKIKKLTVQHCQCAFLVLLQLNIYFLRYFATYGFAVLGQKLCHIHYSVM